MDGNGGGAAEADKQAGDVVMAAAATATATEAPAGGRVEEAGAAAEPSRSASSGSSSSSSSEAAAGEGGEDVAMAGAEDGVPGTGSSAAGAEGGEKAAGGGATEQQQQQQQPQPQQAEEQKVNRTPLETRLDEVRAQNRDPSKAAALKGSMTHLAKRFAKMADNARERRLRAEHPLVKKFITSVPGMKAFCEEAGFRTVDKGKKVFFEIPDDAWRPEAAEEAARLLSAALSGAAEERPAADEPPRKCVANCGFYGSPKTEYLCSSCHNKKYNIGGPSQRSTGADGCVEKCGNFGSAARGGMCSECYRKKNAPRTRQQKWRTATVKVRALVRFRMGAPARPVQEKTNRCWQCRKFIGISGIPCRCGYIFCGKHRYAGEHNCRFNYVREQQRKLLRENPALKRDKMDKL